MRKMIVQSETDKEDASAAIHISNVMRRDDCGQIIWYSNMGKKLAQLDVLEQALKTQGRWIQNLQDAFSCMKREFDKLSDVCRSLQEAALINNPKKKAEKVKNEPS